MTIKKHLELEIDQEGIKRRSRNWNKIMKIKIFYLHEDIDNYEDEINKFIKNKKVIDIKHSISSYGMANNYTSSEEMDMSTLVMYEELEELKWNIILVH